MRGEAFVGFTWCKMCGFRLHALLLPLPVSDFMKCRFGGIHSPQSNSEFLAHLQKRGADFISPRKFCLSLFLMPPILIHANKHTDMACISVPIKNRLCRDILWKIHRVTYRYVRIIWKQIDSIIKHFSFRAIEWMSEFEFYFIFRFSHVITHGKTCKFSFLKIRPNNAGTFHFKFF